MTGDPAPSPFAEPGDRFSKKKTGEQGVAAILGGTPPVRYFGGGVGGKGLVFFGGCRFLIGTFLRILSKRSALFFKSSPTCSNFFCNPQLAMRSFFAIFTNRSAVFLKISARNLTFFCKAQYQGRTFFPVQVPVPIRFRRRM